MRQLSCKEGPAHSKHRGMRGQVLVKCAKVISTILSSLNRFCQCEEITWCRANGVLCFQRFLTHHSLLNVCLKCRYIWKTVGRTQTAHFTARCLLATTPLQRQQDASFHVKLWQTVDWLCTFMYLQAHFNSDSNSKQWFMMRENSRHYRKCNVAAERKWDFYDKDACVLKLLPVLRRQSQKWWGWHKTSMHHTFIHSSECITDEERIQLHCMLYGVLWISEKPLYLTS